MVYKAGYLQIFQVKIVFLYRVNCYVDGVHCEIRISAPLH